MHELEKNTNINDLTTLLAEKRNLYNQMITHEREFEEVKTLFIEIRELEKMIRDRQTEKN
jgi:hypothetical protein